jgi:isopropylmalate/homocitrate/citramalate synthase
LKKEALMSDDNRIWLCDATLREGEQNVDVGFSLDEKVEIAEILGEIGVDLVQVGLASGDAPDVVDAMSARGVTVPAEILCMSLMTSWEEDIKRAVASGADTIQVLIRSSDATLSRTGHSKESAVARCAAAVSLAVAEGARTVVIGSSFTTEADRRFVLDLHCAGIDSGARRSNIADSAGLMHPDGMAELAAHVCEATNAPIGVHCHNDLGLATANALRSVQSGATWVDVTALGLGERAGNVPLEVMATMLARLTPYRTGVDLSTLTRGCIRIGEIAGLDVPGWMSVVGANAFAQQLDQHVALADVLQPYPPELVGGIAELVLGKGSGAVAVRTKAAELGLEISEQRLPGLVSWVNDSATARKSRVTDAEFRLHIAELEEDVA